MTTLTAFDWALVALPITLAVIGMRSGAVWVLLSPLPRAVIAFVLTLLALLATTLILAKAGFFKTFHAMMPAGYGLGSFALRTLGLVVFVAYLGMFLHGLGRIRQRAQAWTLRAQARDRLNQGLGMPAGIIAGIMVCLAMPVPAATVVKMVSTPDELPAIHRSVLLPSAQRGLVAIMRWAIPAVPRPSSHSI